MVIFKVLKEEIEEMKSGYEGFEGFGDFEIPIQITLEGYEQGLGLRYLENELRGRDTMGRIRVKSNDKMLVGFRKAETNELPSIIKSIEQSLELIIKKHATAAEKREKQRIESGEKRKQDLEEVKKKLEKLDFS